MARSKVHCVLHTWIALSVAAWLPTCWGEASTCPEDVNGATRLCLQGYHQQLQGLPLSMKQLFIGVDVEVIRTICSQLRSSFQCAADIGKRCPQSEHAQIQLVLSDVNNMAELCLAPSIFDVYARNMNCYVQQSPYSERCYHAFLAATETIEPYASAGDRQALVQLCGHMETFISCVETNLRLQCNTEASSLARYLIRPSVRMSEGCRNETLPDAKSTPSPPRETYEEIVSNAAGLGSGFIHSLGTLTTGLSVLLACLWRGAPYWL